MSRRATFWSSIVGVGLAATMTAAPLAAETVDRLTYLTFSGSVQVPGTRLDAGTYRFRLANPETGRNVIQVLSYDGSIVYAMFHTTPDSRTTLTEESTVTFRETPAGVPPAVKSLFYGGEYRGYQFTYPTGGPVVTAESLPQPEITYAPITEPAEAVTVARAEPPPAPILEPSASVSAESAAEPQPAVAELPHTASPVPLVALGGLASLILGLGANLMRRILS
jgi:hypothetical protein